MEIKIWPYNAVRRIKWDNTWESIWDLSVTYMIVQREREKQKVVMLTGFWKTRTSGEIQMGVWLVNKILIWDRWKKPHVLTTNTYSSTIPRKIYQGYFLSLESNVNIDHSPNWAVVCFHTLNFCSVQRAQIFQLPLVPHSSCDIRS